MDIDQNTGTNPQAPAEGGEKSGAGPAIGAGIVIILLALGALYFWSENTDRELRAVPTTADSAQTADESWQAPTGNSDDAAAIEAELAATDMNAFEQNMNADAEATNSLL